MFVEERQSAIMEELHATGKVKDVYKRQESAAVLLLYRRNGYGASEKG